MSNLKSKFLLGVMVVAVMFAGVVALGANKAAAANNCTFTTTLRVGSKGAEVKCLQGSLGLTADGSFGPKTKAAVVVFQKNAGLTADGVFGKKSVAVWMTYNGVVTTGGTVNCPVGQFDPTTGHPCSGTVVTQQSGPLAVSLSSDNPASGYVIKGQAGADLAHFVFTGSGTVSSITLQRTGVSDSSTLANVYLYDGFTRLTGGYSFNTNGTIVMNGLGVAVNGSKMLSVKADVSPTTTSSSVGVALTSYTAAGNIANLVNVSGNQMTVGTSTIAAVNFPSATVSPAASSINAGSTGQNLWSRSLTVSQHAVNLHALTLKMIGSAPSNTLSNVALFIDGVSVGTSTINSNSQFVFALATPYSLSTGSHLVEVHGDVVGGAFRNFYLSLEQGTDLAVEDSQMPGVYVSTTSAGGVAVNVTGGVVTINNGTLTINQDTAFNNTTTLVGGATNTTMASYKVASYGEDVKITSLTFTPTIALTNAVTALATQSATGSTTVTVGTAGTGYLATPTVTVTLGTCTGASAAATATMANGSITAVTTSGLTCTVGQTFTLAIQSPAASAPALTVANVGLYVNGGQIGSNQTATTATPLVFSNLGSQLLITGGVPALVQIKGDVMTSGNVNYTAGTFKFDIAAGSSNAQGMSSSQLTSTPTGSGQQLTVASTNVTFASTTGFSPSVKAPNQTVKIGSYTVQTGSSEGITLNSVSVDLSSTAMVAAHQITNLTLKDSSTSTVIGTPIGNPVATGNSFSVALPVAVSSTKIIDVYADFGSSASGTVTPSMTITYRGNTSNLSTTSASVVGIATTAGTPTIAVVGTLVSASSPTSQYVLGGSTTANIATFNIKTSNNVGGAIIKDMTFTVPANTISSVTVNGKTAQVVSTTAVINNVGLTVPSDNSGLNFPVGVTLVCAAQGGGCPAGASGSVVTLTLSSYTFNDGSSILTVNTTPVSTPNHLLVTTKPTITVATPVGAVLGIGSIEAIDVTVTADAAGTVKLVSFPITSTLSAGAGSPLFTAGVITVKDSSGTTVGTTAGAGFDCTSSTTCAVTVAFTGGYTLNAGQSQTFKVFLPVAAVGTGTLPNTYMYTHLVSSSAFSWVDVAGSATPITDVTYVYQYPNTTTISVHN
ncbi:peptidoglycan-binding protein [Candidatus Nomurabacteria bacterium]|nr:peptidoglycan-binding protein [Candidatus Nomurabacteria bacterium]